ncbi:N-acetyltransferase [Parashewanella spongiae]|uniref:N-acetyltransferase n=1 Tax=Parashewanella spongiae TaxID=342950 RepID=A0A3A6U8S8_9GAMM|nr:GNAT family N-acetyltransferase [Parashewanella spongiae]MCL1077900.1 GNAT family N-acetyltransferase [Parashewanella spongiae]RJY14946.1 N-acetyltransferase [Parashewanella spongiae]
MAFLTTERLSIRRIEDHDRDFIFRLVNTPGYIKFIGDNKVRTIEHAKAYIINGPKTSYQQFGFGLYLVMLKDTSVPIGVCGLTKREFLSFVEIGYAYLPPFWGNGYAKEAAKAVFEHGYQSGVHRIMGVVRPENEGSKAVLSSLGLRYIRDIMLPDEEEYMDLMG